MLRRLGRHIRQNAVAWLALFVALGGTGAYAANTIATGDIIDNQVLSPDVRDDTLAFGGLAAQDLGPGSVGSSEVQDSSLSGTEILNSSLNGGDIAPSSLTGSDVQDNSLTGADINEANLVLPPTTTATFAGQGNRPVGNVFNKIIGKTLPAGSYALTATANIAGTAFNDRLLETFCELRNPSGAAIGFARDQRFTQSLSSHTVSLSMNGGAQVPAGGGEVSLWCRYDGGDIELVGDGSIMIVRVDGFF
jgi:hypothetical protein